jgi:predicted DNA-binding transcriptional regulator AlpA
MKVQNFDAPMWRLPTVLSFTGVSRTAWLDTVKSGAAPAPVRVPGRRIVLWPARDVKQWVEALPRTTDMAGV